MEWNGMIMNGMEFWMEWNDDYLNNLYIIIIIYLFKNLPATNYHYE